MKIKYVIQVVHAICNSTHVTHYIHSYNATDNTLLVMFSTYSCCENVKHILESLSFVSSIDMGCDSDGDFWLELSLIDVVYEKKDY